MKPGRCAPFAKDLSNLVSLHNMAEAYGCRPSSILELETAWGAWQLDQVALIVGRRVENNRNEGKATFAGFSGQSSVSSGQQFRSARGRVRKKVKVKADGTW